MVSEKKKYKIFDLSTHEMAERSLELYKKDEIENTYFYHFTTCSSQQRNYLYDGLKPLSKVITDSSTLLGSFLEKNNIRFYCKNNNPFISYNGHSYLIESGGSWNDIAARLENDNGISGFFIPYHFDYSCIYKCPEILRYLDSAIYELDNIRSRPLKGPLQTRWEQEHFKTYILKCLVPMDKIEEKRPNFFKDAAELAANKDFNDIDDMSEFVYVEDKDCNMIEVKDVKEFKI